jgi:thiosulfate/3-mercaptopyruvate sulfurtransferase
MNNLIVSPKWLNENRNDSNLIILDASAKSNKSGLKTNFENIQIKGARFIDKINQILDW